MSYFGITYDDLKNIRDSHPEIFWKTFHDAVMSIGNTDFSPQKQFAIRLIEQHSKLDRHHWLIKLDDLWELHFFAQTEEQKKCPPYYLVGYIPFPNEHFYVTICTTSGVHVFCPHFFEQYALRSDRRPGIEQDIPREWLPKDWKETAHRIPESGELSSVHIKDLKVLKMLVAKFVGNNKLLIVSHVQQAQSKKKQVRNQDKLVPTAITDSGICFGEYYDEGKLLLQKTFVDPRLMKEDQIKALTPALKALLDKQHELFPVQYPDDFYASWMNFLRIKQTI